MSLLQHREADKVAEARASGKYREITEFIVEINNLRGRVRPSASPVASRQVLRESGARLGMGFRQIARSRLAVPVRSRAFLVLMASNMTQAGKNEKPTVGIQARFFSRSFARRLSLKRNRLQRTKPKKTEKTRKNGSVSQSVGDFVLIPGFCKRFLTV